MSRPKTGSVTGAPRRRERDAVDPQQRPSPSSDAERAADGQGDEAPRRSAMTDAADRRQVGQVAGVDVDGGPRTRSPGRPARSLAGPGGPTAGRRSGRFVEPVEPAAEPCRRRTGPRRPAARGGRASQRLPSRTTRASTSPPTNSPTCAPRRVQKTASKPTLAIPDRIGPRGRARRRAHDDTMTSDDDDRDRPRPSCRRIPRPAAVVRAADGPSAGAARAAGRRRRGRLPTAGAADRERFGLVGVVGLVAPSSTSSGSRPRRSSSVVVAPGSGSSSRLGPRSGRSAAGRRRRPARLGLAASKLVHELVEQFAHGVAESSLRPRLRPFDRRAGSRRGPCRRARSDASPRPARLEPERGPDAAGHAPRPGRVVGGDDGASRIWRRPASSRISPDRAPANGRPRRASGGSGGGPAAGATSRKRRRRRRR